MQGYDFSLTHMTKNALAPADHQLKTQCRPIEHDNG